MTGPAEGQKKIFEGPLVKGILAFESISPLNDPPHLVGWGVRLPGAVIKGGCNSRGKHHAFFIKKVRILTLAHNPNKKFRRKSNRVQSCRGQSFREWESHFFGEKMCEAFFSNEKLFPVFNYLTLHIWGSHTIWSETVLRMGLSTTGPVIWRCYRFAK